MQRHRKTQLMSDLEIGLLSGIVGALIGALATLRVARQQLALMTRQHKEALEHQNELLRLQFENQLRAQVAEFRLASQLRLAQRLHEYLTTTAREPYLRGHRRVMRSFWRRRPFETCSA